MFRNRRRPWLARLAVAGAAGLLAVGTAACGSSSGPAGGNGASAAAAAAGGTAKVALPAGVTLNYIWPYTPAASAGESNAEDFQMLMYRPLYLFGNNGSSADVNYLLSLASAPAYSNGGKTATVHLKGWKWSNGESVDASDVVFWINMMKAEPDQFYGYAPGLFPDNVASYSAPNANTVVLNLKSKVSSLWFTYNQLAEVTPMPAAWDITSAGAKAGSGGCATDSAADKWAKCQAVYKFLSAQAQDVKSYATSSIWGVVDGPWKLSSFSAASSGAVTSFVPNKSYSGSPKAELDDLTYYAYTDDSTEYTALKTGQINVGYIPPADLSPVSGSQVLPSTSPLGSSYTLSAAYGYDIKYFAIDFNNPRLGTAYKQLYVRQAIQELVDQEGIIESVDRGYGYPTSGGVPARPSNQWVASVQNANGGQGPYAYSVTHADNLLTSHGWKEVGSVMTCESPGAAGDECGSGVAKGTKLSMKMDYASGQTAFREEAAVIKSDMASGGIQLNLVRQSFDTVTGESAPCRLPQPSCDWELLNLGGWNFNGPGFEPTGEPLFETGAGSNPGSYSDSLMDSLISQTHTSSSLATFHEYAQYVAEQLPIIWLPNAYTVAATSSNLAGVENSPLGTFLPEYWHFTE
jgi:peptide/nickel transport system substrate-binding protein